MTLEPDNPTRDDLAMALIHLAFVALGAFLLEGPERLAAGVAAGIFVVAYNIFIPLYAYLRRVPRYLDLWSFLFPLSVLQLLPDWFLVEGLGALAFPDLYVPSLGPVPLFLGGLWTMPLLISVAVGLYASNQFDERTGSAVTGVTALLVFGLGEFFLTKVPLWTPVDVFEIGGVAGYILPAEIILSVAALFAYRRVAGEGLLKKTAAAAGVMLVYGAAASLFYGLFELLG